METKNSFLEVNQNVALRLKTIAVSAFVYRSTNDLPALIKFVGSEPKAKIVDSKLVLSYKKSDLFDDCIVISRVKGEVSQILTMDEAAQQYDIIPIPINKTLSDERAAKK